MAAASHLLIATDPEAIPDEIRSRSSRSSWWPSRGFA